MLIKEILKIKSGKKELREFGWLVGGVACAIGGLMLWHQKPLYPWFLGVGAALVALGTLAPFVLKPFQKVWMGFALVMGFIMSRVILFIVFFLVVTPIALVLKLTGKRFLDMSFKDNVGTYWRAHRTIAGRDEYENQF
jgi:hypothetical protein